MATLEQQFEWLKEILNDHDGHYSGFIKSEVADYFNLDEIEAEDLKDLLNKKFRVFRSCEKFEDVEEFVSRIVSYIQMHFSAEDMISDYLCQESAIPIKYKQF